MLSLDAARWYQVELFPNALFIVTNFNKRAKNVVKSYNGHATAEQWIKKGKNVV